MACLWPNICKFRRKGCMGFGKLHKSIPKLLSARIGDFRLFGNGKVFFVCHDLPYMHRWHARNNVTILLFLGACVTGCVICLASDVELAILFINRLVLTHPHLMILVLSITDCYQDICLLLLWFYYYPEMFDFLMSIIFYNSIIQSFIKS